jgi:hypothetical protein
MRWTIITIVAVAALVGATFAVASGGGLGDQGGGAAAYALVDPNGGSPRLVSDRTSGFVAVSSPFAGDYCLTPAPGVDVVNTAAVASEEAFYSDVVGFPTVRYDPTHANCTAKQLEVKTFDQTPALTTHVAFAVNVP